jgi:hypothetical protein
MHSDNGLALHGRTFSFAHSIKLVAIERALKPSRGVIAEPGS